jgi:acyl-coenzyme A thioesterase PaaI-like protein
VRGGVLLSALDMVGGLTGGLAALPRWVVSTNLMQRVATAHVEGALLLEAWTRRVGKAAVVDEIVGRDEASGAVVVSGVLTSAILTKHDGIPIGDRPVRITAGEVRPEAFPPLLGARPVDEQTVELGLLETLRNPWGILHGVAVSVLADVAAQHAVEAATGRPGVVTDGVVHFVAPGRVGPVRAHAQVIGARPDGHVVRVEQRDAGADERVTSFAILTVAP